MHVGCRGCCDGRSDVDLLRDLNRIIDLDTEIPDRGLNLGVPLDCLFVGRASLRPAIRDRASCRAVETDIVWRLPPSLRGVEENSAKWQDYNAIGESDRMTLKFVKPSQ